MIRKRDIILGALGLGVIAAVVLLLREPEPQAVLRRAQARLASEKTMHVEFFATLVGAPQEIGAKVTSDATSVDIAVSTDIDRSAPERPASVSTFDVRQGNGAGGLRLAGEERRKDGAHYLRLATGDGFEASGAERLIGVWAKYDRPFTELIFPPTERALAEHPLDAAGIATARAAFSSLDLFTVKEKLASEKIDGEKTYHYAVETDWQGVSALLLKLRELHAGAPLDSKDVLELTNEIVRWGKPVGEVWIGRRDGRLRKIMLGTEIGEGTTAIGAFARAEFSRYGQPVAVAAPEAEDLEKLLGPQFTRRLSLAGDREATETEAASASPITGLPSVPGSEVQLADADGDGLADGQEAFYGSDAWSPDTDADGWSDGLEVDKGMDPVGPGPLFSFGL